MHRLARVAVLLLALPLLAAPFLVQAWTGDEGAITIRMRFTRFEPEVVTVRAGEPFTFVLQNDDPIEHEWMVGDDAMHERHRTGTYHDQIPTEVTVPALETRRTTVTFDEPGEYVFACHLPGHEAYGMRGVLRVLPAEE